VTATFTHRYSLLASVVGACMLLASCGQIVQTGSEALQSASPTSTAPLAQAPTTSSGPDVTPTVTAHVDGHAFEILSSPTATGEWVPVFSGTELALDQFNAEGKLISSTPLGRSGSSGINSHIRFGPSGNIWVSDDYTIYEINPLTNVVRSLSLSIDEIRTDFEGDSTWIEGGSITTIQLAEQTLQVASPLGGISEVTAKDRVSGAGLGESGGLWLLLAALGGGTDLAQLT